jgi:hypothetical protein
MAPGAWYLQCWPLWGLAKSWLVVAFALVAMDDRCIQCMDKRLAGDCVFAFTAYIFGIDCQYLRYFGY